MVRKLAGLRLNAKNGGAGSGQIQNNGEDGGPEEIKSNHGYALSWNQA